ncbi:MAG: hemolysin family protein [Phenylobacterium sp.]|uniref:hemolysin family protein n=1 Tax=Phenylobacterium sp. TaxID=1871053 RepID=UPI0039191443
MTSSSDGSSSRPEPARPSRGVRAFLRRLRGQNGGESPAAAPAPDTAGHMLVERAAAFQSMRVSDVMTPRADIVAVELSAPFSEVVERFVEAEHSRMPIFRETLDDPVGVIHVKDIFKLLAGGPGRRPGPNDLILQRLRRDALYVPGSMRAADLLLRMQAERTHMALVIDEFGGTDGLVTMEDLVEAVVGEIDDEHDEAAAAEITARPGGVFDVDARAPLETLEEALRADLMPADFEEEIDTVGGLVSALAGRVPQRGELIVHPLGFEISILDADPRRIKRVRVKPAAPGEPAAAA